MVKIKPLLPSLKEKKRYILYEGAISTEIDSKLKGFLGELGLARSGARILMKKGNKGIIKTNVKYLNDTRSALALIENLKIIRVSGTLNKVMNGG